MRLLKHPPAPAMLLIAGTAIRGVSRYGERMKRLAADVGVASRVVWMGQLEPAEMSWCFTHCEAFVMTSRVEACPNIALEALSHGCRVISTTRPPMPEIFADGATYYRAGCEEELAHRIMDLARQRPAETRRMWDIARRRAAQFSWSRTAEGTVQELQGAIRDIQ